MKRRLKVVFFAFLAGTVLLGTNFAAKGGKPPATLPLAVTIYDQHPVTNETFMLRGDGGPEYINGLDSVTATVDVQYGELYFQVPSSSPRRVLLQFNEIGKDICPNACVDKKGNPTFPPALGTINAISFKTYGRDAWSCEGRWGVDCTQNFLYLIPGAEGYTNLQVPFYTPASTSNFYMLDYSRECPDYKVIGYAFFKAGEDFTGDGYADEWDLFPVPDG